jgi:hypothetical protein
MVQTVTDHSEVDATTQKPPMRPEQHASAAPSIDKFADARRAKKKEKRARHRARLRRSHTDG